MLRQTLKQKQEIVFLVLRNKLERKEACHILSCTDRTLRNYLSKVLKNGRLALEDKRGGNNVKLTPKQKSDLVKIKEKGRWRSARKAIELTGIKVVGIRQIQNIWVKYGFKSGKH